MKDTHFKYYVWRLAYVILRPKTRISLKKLHLQSNLY